MWLSEPLNLSLSHDLNLLPEIPRLEADDLHLFRFPRLAFESQALEVHYLEGLSPEEKERARSIKNTESRGAFIQSRARLRWFLGHQLEITPVEVPLAIGPYGKPHLRSKEIEFNLSHTQGLILIGMARGVELGVDVEQLRPTRRLEALIREVFATKEQRRFQGLAEAEQQDMFLRGWTLKEAFVKATGRGIAAGLSRVVIREDFQGFEAIPEGDPLDYQVFESAFSTTRMALVHRGEIRTILYYQGSFES
jgi:4'-phosphopantetheinyl transferase